MKIQEFIKQKLLAISDMIPSIAYRYAYEKEADTHVLEFTPFELLKAKDEYMELFSDISMAL